MAKYYIESNDGKGTLYIKDIDFAQTKLTFTKNEEEAYVGRNGFYANATKDMIKRNFSEMYPEVANLMCSAPYY